MPRRKRRPRHSPELPSLSDAEWEVMHVVWERGPVAAADVHAALAERRDWSARTVKTLLARLVAKGAAGYEEDGKRYLYRALVAREDCQRRAGRHLLARIFEGSASPLLAYFVREGRLSREEIAELRHLLDEEERKR